MLNSFLLFFAVHSFAATANLSLEEGSHCVAYKVKHTMFLLKDSFVVGKNCDVAAQVLPELGGLYHIEVNVPVRSFSSGDEERDRDVLKILKGEQRPELTFRSKAHSGSEWQKLFGQKAFPLEGQLFIGEKSYPLTLQVKYIDKTASAEVHGTAQVKFEDFAIKTPKVAGGIVAKADSEFELLFHLQSQRILGADSIRLKQEKK